MSGIGEDRETRGSNIPYLRIYNGNSRGVEDSSEEHASINSEQGDGPQVKVYKRRWYVLLLFCLLNLLQCFLWNSWGPVSDSATLVFGWTGAEIGLFATLGNAAYCLAVFPVSYILDAYGLRISSIGMGFLLLVAGGIKCITSQEVVLYWMSVLSAILSGVAGTVTFAGPALFASVWFPPSQRTTANALIGMFNYLGVSVSFIVGPNVVKYVKPKNVSALVDHFSYPHWTGTPFSAANSSGSGNSTIAEQRQQIMYYMYIQTGVAGLLFLLVLMYFPAKPPLPPSLSASTSRLNFRSGLWKLTKSRSFWLLALAYALPAGVFGVWGAVLNVNLHPIGISQDTAGQIGLYYSLAGGAAGVGISMLADSFAKHMKLTLIILYVFASVTLFWMSLICQAIIPFNTASVFVAAILASIFVNSGTPLFYELTCEVCYPVAEGIIGGYITLLNNVVGIIFLSVLYIPHIGTSWMTWTMFGCTVISIPPLLLLKERYGRLAVDSNKVESTDDSIGDESPVMSAQINA